MTAKLLDSVDFIDQDRTHVWEDNFAHFNDGDLWTKTTTDSGAVTALTTEPGIALTPSDGTVADNDETYIGWTNKNMVPTADKPLLFRGVIQFAEANTDDANIMVGFASTSAANMLLDNGGGPPASYTGLVFFKIDGGNNWWIEASVGGTQTTVELTAANSLTGTAQTAGGSAKQSLRIEFLPYSSTKAWVIWYIDGVAVYKLDWTFTSAAAVSPVFGVKNGGANQETLNVYTTKGKRLR